MKKQLSIMFCLGICILSILSCKRTNSIEIEKQYSDQEIIRMFSDFGELHNQGLEYIYDDIVKDISKMKDDKEQRRKFLFELIDKSSVEFVSRTFCTKNIDFGRIIKNCNENNNINDYLRKDLVSQIKSLPQSIRLSNAYFEAMEELNSVMKKNEKRAAFDNIISSHIGNLSDFDEKMKLVISVNIGYSSLQYWKSNILKWKNIITYTSQNAIQKSGMSIEFEEELIYGAATDLGRADISGIIAGAIYGCAYGAIGGTAVLPGVGTLTGCAGLGASGAITGGLGNSGKSAVESFVKWLSSK